jgi:hypothetical protein
MAKGKMSVNEQIHRRHGNSNGQCALCGSVESISHIFFSCAFARLMWSGIREAFGVQWNPQSLPNFLSILNQLTPSVRQSFWVLFAAQCWALWLIGKWKYFPQATCWLLLQNRNISTAVEATLEGEARWQARRHGWSSSLLISSN